MPTEACARMTCLDDWLTSSLPGPTARRAPGAMREIAACNPGNAFANIQLGDSE